MKHAEICDICGFPLLEALPRTVPWEVVTCGDPRCEYEAPAAERDARREWRDQMVQDQGLDDE